MAAYVSSLFKKCIISEVKGLLPHHQPSKKDSIVDYSYNDTYLEPSFSFNILSSSKGVFIHGSKQDKTHQMYKLLDNQVQIKQIACTDTRIIILFHTGELFKCNIDKMDLIRIGNNIHKVSCGVTMTVAVTDNGSVLNLPHKLQFKCENVKNVVTGREHCLILDGLGKVYSFGHGSRGQLGHGCLEDEMEPKIIEALDGIKINEIAAGGWHSCAISVEGDLYTWGWNANGQLGIYDNAKQSVAVNASPQVIDFDGDIAANIVKVACGNRHTIALLENGKLYGCGWNKYSQLGSAAQEENVHTFICIYNLEYANVVDLKCGPWSSLIICS